MASLFSALHSSSDTLKAYQETLAVIQNNVGNASTPGFVAQQPVLEAAPYQVGEGLNGGVIFRAPSSAKDVFADATVRRETSQYAFSAQQAASYTTLQSSFDITGNGGIATAFNQFFAAAAAFSGSPADLPVRSQLLNSAGQLASAFRAAANNVETEAQTVTGQVQSTVAQINALSAQLQRSPSQAPGREDPAVDSRNRETLEALSKLANVTARTETDGSLTVLLGGQTPLVIGGKSYALSTALQPGPSPGTPTQALFSANGKDVTSQVTTGSLGALLRLRNQVVPGLIGGSSQSGSLNDLARSFSDRVNTLLGSGFTSSETGAAAGSNLFAYDATTPGNVAASLTLDPQATATGLAAASSTSSNGIANALAALADGKFPADQINGQTFSTFYATIAAEIGRQTADATSQQASDQQSLLQVKNLRAQISGVSLDAEAERLIEFQRAYQAAAKLVTVLDQLTQSTISLIP